MNERERQRRERERRADEAFFDGLLLGHYWRHQDAPRRDSGLEREWNAGSVSYGLDDEFAEDELDFMD